MDKSSSLGIHMHHPKKYPRSTSVKTWGCPRGTPSSSAKIRSPFKTLYFYCFMHYAFFLEHQLFLFLVFFCFVCCNKWLITSCGFGGRHTSLFICQEHSVFHSYRFNECSLFLLQRLACIFRLDFCSYLVISFHQGVFLPLIFIGFHEKRCL
jgi:hypothetical protein